VRVEANAAGALAPYCRYYGFRERASAPTQRREGPGADVVLLVPPLARAVLGVPLDTLANRVVPLDEVLGDPSLAERVHDAGSWPERFRVLDNLVLRRLADADGRDAGVVWAWRQLTATHGRSAIGTLAAELGWSRKRIVARFRDEVGVTPKTFARLVRFERAVDQRPDTGNFFPRHGRRRLASAA
jgi:AraC-like DNA-binding protein